MSRFLSQAPPGIVVEVGVWKGGSLKWLSQHHPDRMFYGFDTFQGMPSPAEVDNFHKRGDFSDTSLEDVQRSLSDVNNVILAKGLFPESDITSDQPIALVHCDVDLYESTIKTMRHLWPRVVSGGRIYCDDAFAPTCEGATLAVCEFAVEHRRTLKQDIGNHAFFEKSP